MTKNINIQVKKDNRSAGHYFHKMPRVDATRVKRIALSDISKECGKGKFFTRNYVLSEFLIMQLKQLDFEYIDLNLLL